MHFMKKCQCLLTITLNKLHSCDSSSCSPNQTIKVLITGKRIVGYGLEIPVEYVFNGNEEALQWAKKKLDNIDENVSKKVGRCLKEKFECAISNLWFLFCFTSLSATGR